MSNDKSDVIIKKKKKEAKSTSKTIHENNKLVSTIIAYKGFNNTRPIISLS